MTPPREVESRSVGVGSPTSSFANTPSTLPGGKPPRTFGQNIAHTARVFGTIYGVLGAAAVANALTAGAFNSTLGLIPRNTSHAWGILLHPLLHANARHLGLNAVGILLMGGLVFLREERDFWRVTALGILVGGGMTWLVGRSDIHVGASGVVFAYLGYLLTTGWFDRKIGAIVLSLAVAALWGSALFGLSPFQQGISWELHLFGLIGGIAGAWWRKRQP
ncbi:MAG: rhomboid family intramembrane serine protease [Gemmatimonadaceae bacterium]